MGAPRTSLKGSVLSMLRADGEQVFLILALSKISFCLFLLRISQFNKLQKLLWALIAVVAAFTLPLFLVFLFQCQPIWKYWRREVEGYCVPKLTVMKIMVLQGCFSVITDLICAVIPSFLFRELRISRQSKTALCILMGLGVLTAAACTVRTSFSYQVRSDDVSWIGVPNAIARIVEVHTSNIAASAPILKPLYRYLRARWSGADPNKVIFRRAPPPSLSRWMTRFRITSSSKPDETEEKRRMQDTDDSSKSRKSSNREVSANQNLDLPLQGDPSNSKIGNNIDSIVNIEAGSHNDWPLSNEAPMHGVTQKRKQKHRTEGEVVIGSNTRSTTENAEDTCDDDLDFGSWKAPKKRQASQL